jgi:transposase
MEEILDRCCGLDVHRDSITACIMVGFGKQIRKEIKTFLTFTADIEALAEWLKLHEIKHVAVESTGIYWKPIFNVMEAEFDICLVNAQHAKQVPGRKTDVKDSEWLCRLLKCGLLNKSFIPPRAIVRLRELTRYRQKIVKELTSEKNRVIKALESSNIKLSTVFSDVFGVTAWGIVIKLVDGETDIDVLMSYIDRRVRSSRSDIKKALNGTLQKEDRAILQIMMKHVSHLQELITTIETMIAQHLEPFKVEVDLLKTIPGVKDTGAAAIIAEIGIDMDQFQSANHLTAWSGLCPGNNESAGKIKSSRIRKGNVHLKVVITQTAWAASRTKDTYFGSKYRALAPRKGKKRTIVAIGRKMLIACYHMLQNKVSFKELGPKFLDSLEPHRKAKYHTMRLEELGFHVELKEKHVDKTEDSTKKKIA